LIKAVEVGKGNFEDAKQDSLTIRDKGGPTDLTVSASRRKSLVKKQGKGAEFHRRTDQEMKDNETRKTKHRVEVSGGKKT